MSILSLSPAILRKIVILAEKREKLLSEVRKVESEIRSLEASKPLPRETATPKQILVTTGRRGRVKEAILAELQAAGDTGVSVQEIASKTGIKGANLHVWFSSTGKKLGIRKIGPGKYAI